MRVSSSAKAWFARPKMLRAPIVSSRSRSGNAWTDWNPAASAAGANCGQRDAAVGEVGVDDGLLAPEAVEAGALRVLQLEKLEQLALPRRRRP